MSALGNLATSKLDRRAYGEIFVYRRHSRPPDVFPLTLAKGYAERLIGSIRRECIDHIVVFGERHPRYVLLSYKDYYNATRTHS